ncbi:MAG: hypothetical protein KBT21_09865 [Treponema sp.]|nr:hypothetical protein [Candidatus Treponema merdequi]
MPMTCSISYSKQFLFHVFATTSINDCLIIFSTGFSIAKNKPNAVNVSDCAVNKNSGITNESAYSK